MKKEEDNTVLRKDQISSYFERIQPKKDGDDPKKIGFSVGSSSTATDARGSHRTATEKTALLSSYLIPTSSDAAAATPASMTLEEEKASCAARCLAILGVAPSSATTTKSLPTKEEIIKSRKLREQEIMKKSEEIIRIQEENRKRRPLIWDKPTFCPYGGETKSDEDEAEEKSKKKRKVSGSCSNLLSKSSSKRNRGHDTLFPYNMFGRMSGQSSTSNVGMDWNKAQVDSFVSFTDQMIAAAGEKKREQDGTVSDSSSDSEEEEEEFRRR
jgi:hypothetical protein